MPTLTRFIFVVSVVVLTGYAGLIALADLVEPRQREIATIVELHPKATEPHRPGRAERLADIQSAAHARLVTTLESLPFARE